jgi:hypothetical protein
MPSHKSIGAADVPEGFVDSAHISARALNENPRTVGGQEHTRRYVVRSCGGTLG